MSRVKRKGPPTGGARLPRAVTEGRKRKVIYAVVEGERTEHDYLAYLEERFSGDPQTFEIHVLWRRNGLKPSEVTDRALEKTRELDDPQREQVWAFFDRDDHDQLRGAHPAFRNFGKRLDGPHRQALDGKESEAANRAKTLITNCPSLICTSKNGHAGTCKVIDRVPSTDVWRLLVELGIVSC